MIPLIELHHVFMSFPVDKNRMMQAAYDIDFVLGASEMVAVVGESGCGKSTLAKICLGILKPSRGVVFHQSEYIWERDFRWTAELRSAVQVIHQDSFSSLNPVRTVYQTLAAPLRYHKIATRSQARQKVSELLTSVDLTPVESFMFKYPFQLSGGQRQRVSIARATILKPKVIIADEPVSAVDASMRLAVLDLMRRLNREHDIAFLYITHDLATARYFAPQGRLIVMYLGRMVEQGIIEECVRRPVHPYLRALLKAIPGSDPARAKDPVTLPLKSFDMPNATNPPAGCVFHPRCPYATEICEKQVPELAAIEKYRQRRVACHHNDQLISGE